MAPDDLRKADTTKLTRIVAEAESYLAAQLQSGIAADQRAMSFISLLAAATAVVGAGGVSLLWGEKPHMVLGWIALAMVAGLLGAMACAIFSAQPAPFYYAGSMPEDWIENVQGGTSMDDSLREQAANYNANIAANDTLLKQNAEWMRRAIWITWFTLSAGGGAGVGCLAYTTYRLVSGTTS